MANPLTETLGSMNFSVEGAATVMFYIAIAIVVLGLLFALGWFLWKKKQFRYTCYILEELSDGGTRMYSDKGRIQRRPDDTKVFRLKYFKHAKLQIPPLNAFMVGQKGQQICFLKKFGVNEFDFIPLGVYLKSLDVDVTPFPQGRSNWISTELKRSAQRHGSFWEKYGAIIMQFSVMLFAFIMLIVIFKMMQDIGANLQSVAGTLQTAIDNLASSCGGGTQNIPGGGPGF